jgi:hypothetical protein
MKRFQISVVRISAKNKIPNKPSIIHQEETLAIQEKLWEDEAETVRFAMPRNQAS